MCDEFRSFTNFVCDLSIKCFFIIKIWRMTDVSSVCKKIIISGEYNKFNIENKNNYK